MLLLIKDVNEVRLSGNIAKVNIRNGLHGPFGTIRIAIDNGAFNKKGAKFIERTDFINVEVSGKAFFSVVPNPQGGDRIMIYGKLLTDKFNDKNTNQPRESTFVKCSQVLSYTSVEDKKVLQSVGLLPVSKRQSNTSPQPVHHQQDNSYAEYEHFQNQIKRY